MGIERKEFRESHPERCVHTYIAPWAAPYFKKFVRKHKNKSAAARALLYAGMAQENKKFAKLHAAMKLLKED